MKKAAVLRKNKNMVAREFDGEVVLLPIYKTSEEINCIYNLNKVASRVWALIDGKRTVAGLREKILKEFDTTPKEADRELEKLLKDLKEIKAIK